MNEPPVVSGVVSLSDSSGNTIVANWSSAEDDLTSPAALQYQVMYATSNNISNIADALANGTVGKPWTSNITAANISGLAYATNYYVTVLVQDESFSRSIHTVASVRTDNLPVSAGTQHICPPGMVMNGFGGRQGQIIDRLYLQCAPSSNLSPESSEQVLTVGGMGGEPFATFFCPNGAHVKGIQGGNGELWYPTTLASFNVSCSDDLATRSAVSYWMSGSNAFQYTCPVGQRAVGLDITATNDGPFTGAVNNIICQ